jgi:hypothetical protein
MDNVTIKRETLQKLLDNFYEACSLADEMDIYEFEEGDESLQEMKQWTQEKFGYEIEKESYE